MLYLSSIYSFLLLVTLWNFIGLKQKGRENTDEITSLYVYLNFVFNKFVMLKPNHRLQTFPTKQGGRISWKSSQKVQYPETIVK